MKSLALSLLVALGVSLGTVTALADTPRTDSLLSAAAASQHQAQVHAQRAQQYRLAARIATANATSATKVAENDAKLGFTYEAGVERERALKFQQEAQADTALAAREDAIAAQYRAQAHQQMAQYQQMLGFGSPAKR